MGDEIVSTGWHWSYGWLRRPEEDQPFGFCYEDGDGDLIYTPVPPHRQKVYLACRIDSKTGERYVCLHPAPKSLDAKKGCGTLKTPKNSL